MGKGWIRNTVVGLAMSGVVLGAGAQAAGAAPAELPTKSTYSEFEKVPQVYKKPDLTPIPTMNDRMTAMVNKVRAQGRNCGSEGTFPKAPALVVNGKLTKAAQGHATDMAAHNLTGHDGSNGSTWQSRIKAAGYNYSAAAENVGAGYPTEQAVVDGWFASPKHCKNFMNANLKDIGFGKGTNPNSQYKTYWTVDLGRL